MRWSSIRLYLSLLALIIVVSACSNSTPQIQLTIISTPDTVVQGTVYTFEAQLRHSDNNHVVWQANHENILTDVNPNDNKVLLLVPEGITGNVTLTATSAKDRNASDSVTLAITPKQQGLHMQFLGARSLLLTGKNTHADVAVQVIDAQGNIVPNAAVTFVSSHPTKLHVSAESSGTARVEALVAPAFSATITARYQDLTAVATVVVAELHSKTRMVQASDLLSRTADTITLQRNNTTNSLAVGDIVVASNQVGLLHRITQRTVTTNQITFAVEAVTLSDAFKQIDINAQGDKTAINAQMLGGGYALVNMANSSGSLSSQAVIGNVKCSTKNQTGINFDTEAPSVTLSADIRPEVKLDSHWWRGLQSFKVGVVAETGITLSTGKITLSSSVGGKVSCTLPLPSFKTPALDLVIFSLRFAVSANLGLDIEAVLTGPILELAGPNFTIGNTYTAGIIYTPEKQWESYASHNNSNSQFSAFNTRLDIDFDFKAALTPYAKLELGLLIDLGSPPFSINLADVRFMEFRAYGYIRAGINRPTYSTMPAYKGPTWAVGAGAYGKLKAELAGGLSYELINFLRMLGVKVQISVSMDLFKVEKDFVSSPKMSLSTSSTSVTNGQAVTFTASTSNAEKYEGWVTFLGRKEGSDTLVELTTGQFKGSTGTATWTPSASDAGTWQIYGQMKVDFVSAAKGYAQIAPIALTVTQ